jgi:hypothetical protein
VREACAASDPYEFATCQLANPICVNLSVVSAGNYVFYCERGTRVGMNPGGFQPAVSGTGNPDLDVRAGRYDPWETALREATQEFVGAVKVPRASVAFFGFARLHHNRCPFLFGELRLPLTRDAIFSIQVQDRYETRQRRAVPLEPGPVAEACREMYALRDAKGAPSVQAHSTIFSLVMSLLYADPSGSTPSSCPRCDSPARNPHTKHLFTSGNKWFPCHYFDSPAPRSDSRGGVCNSG